MTRRMMIWSIVLATMALGPGIGRRCIAKPPSYDPAIDPADFVRVIDNPYLTLRPGTIFHYASATETNEVEVARDTKTILGVVTTVVRDRVFRAGRVTEDTFDWYAQDKQGNVWYFGEDSREYRNGKPSTGGSWKAGEKGAKPGIIMKAHPKVGDSYRQEYSPGVAEDMGKVVGLAGHASVPYGDFSGCLETMDWSPLEPGGQEHKFYARGVGLVLEAEGGERNQLVRISTRRR